MLKLKLTALTILSVLIFSCGSKETSETETASQTQSINAAEPASNYTENNAGTSSSPVRSEPITTEEKKYNDDGSVTIIKTTTDGVETQKSEETFFPNDGRQIIGGSRKNYSTSNFEEAYSYARKAYQNASDVETANDYLKKAMSYFEDAESDADEADCDDAKSAASDGYDYSKKGYNETDPDEIERFAKKAMNEAEDGKSAMEDCKRNQ